MVGECGRGGRVRWGEVSRIYKIQIRERKRPTVHVRRISKLHIILCGNNVFVSTRLFLDRNSSSAKPFSFVWPLPCRPTFSGRCLHPESVLALKSHNTTQISLLPIVFTTGGVI